MFTEITAVTETPFTCACKCVHVIMFASEVLKHIVSAASERQLQTHIVSLLLILHSVFFFCFALLYVVYILGVCAFGQNNVKDILFSVIFVTSLCNVSLL